MNHHLGCFLFGMAGNVTLEVVGLLGYATTGNYPPIYKDWRFWILRVLLVGCAGVMALAFSLTGFSSELIAFQVGAAASLIIKRMESELTLSCLGSSRPRKRRGTRV